VLYSNNLAARSHLFGWLPKRSRKSESCQIYRMKISATQKSSVLRVPCGSPGGYRTTFSSPMATFALCERFSPVVLPFPS
jgi:hypothetical protein